MFPRSRLVCLFSNRKTPALPLYSSTRSRRSRSREAAAAQDTSGMSDEAYMEQKMRLAEFQTTLKNLAKEAGNKRCADCREHDPRYIDITWGVYLCLLCSGAHEKKLSSKIVTVDTTEVEPAWVDILNQRGNDTVNQDLEDALETRDKRKMSWSITNRAKFCVSKYVAGKWKKPGDGGIDLKNPTKVSKPAPRSSAPAASDFDGGSAGKKKKKKKSKKKKKKRGDDDIESPTQETAPAASAAPLDIFGGPSTAAATDAKAATAAVPAAAAAAPKTATDSLTGLLGLLDTNDAPKPADKKQAQQQQLRQQQQQQPKGAAGGGMFGQDNGTQSILAMFDNAPAQRAPASNPFVGMHAPAPAQMGGSATANPFAAPMGGMPRAGGFPGQQPYGGWQAGAQQQAFVQQQQAAAYQQQQAMLRQQQMRQAQQQQARAQQQKPAGGSDDILGSLFS